MPKPSDDRREAVALALARGASRAHAGQAGGITSRTVRTWLRDGAFAARVVELRKELVSEAAAVLAGLTKAAAATLGELLRSESEHVRMRSAIAILESAIKLRDHVEMEERIERLEALAAGRSVPPRTNGFSRNGHA